MSHGGQTRGVPGRAWTLDNLPTSLRKQSGYEGPTSYGGGELAFNVGQKPADVDPFLWGGYGEIADIILRGTGGAERLVREGFETDYAHRAGTGAAAYREMTRRLSSQAGATGISGDVVSRMLFSGEAEAQSALGADLARSRSAQSWILAELLKGTATELAGVKQAQLGTAADIIVGERTADVAEDASNKELLGTVFGAALAFL